MSLKSPKELYYAAAMGKYGLVEIGSDQLGGNVSAAATYASGLQTKLTVTNAGLPLTKNDTINVAGTTNYNGPHQVVKKISDTEVVINVAFVSDQSGTWNRMAAVGYFYAFSPKTDIAKITDITTLEFQDSRQHKGDPKRVDYTAGLFYPFPGIITKIIIANTANLTLFRYPTDSAQ